MSRTGQATWAAPLHHQPTVISAGVVDHGLRPIERWWLPRVWCLHCYRYEAELVLDGQVYAIKPNCVGIIPPGVEQEYRFGGLSRHTYVHFEMPSGGPSVAVRSRRCSMRCGRRDRRRCTSCKSTHARSPRFARASMQHFDFSSSPPAAIAWSTLRRMA